MIHLLVIISGQIAIFLVVALLLEQPVKNASPAVVIVCGAISNVFVTVVVAVLQRL